MKKLILALLIIGVIGSLVYIQRLRSGVDLTSPPPLPTFSGNQEQTNNPSGYPTATPINTQTKPTITAGNLQLEIISPKNNATVNKSSLTVKGKTSPRAEVFVNEAETKADANGNFSVNLTLDEGENIIVIVANDAEGNSAEKELSITYQP